MNRKPLLEKAAEPNCQVLKKTLLLPGELLGTVKNLAPTAIIHKKERNPPDMIYKPAMNILSIWLRN